MPVDMASSQDAMREWLATSLAAAQRGEAVPFAILAARSGKVLGSTRFLELRFEHGFIFVVFMLNYSCYAILA